jgi:predicted alpha/beta-hydrolase family hydrolase
MPSMPEHAELARAAARRLAPELDPGLEMRVERVLATGGGAASPPTRFEAVSIAIAALVVSVAQFAWQIYRDLKEDREKARDAAAREAIARRIRLEVELPAGVTPAQRDRVIDAVLQELDEEK